MNQKTDFGIFPNEPRRLCDEVIAAHLFGWRWLPYITSRPRKCWVFCPPTVRKVTGLPGGQISGPTSTAECEVKPEMERIAYEGLPVFSKWMAEATNLPPAVRDALDSAQDYQKDCPESLHRQGWHDSYPALVIPHQRKLTVVIYNGRGYVTHEPRFAKQSAAVSFARKAAAGEVDVYDRQLLRVNSLRPPSEPIPSSAQR